MINHYFFLAEAASELRQLLVGSEITAIVSPHLGELRFQFSKGTLRTELRLNWETNFFLFKMEEEDIHLPKQYEKQLFGAWHQTITEVQQAAFDRYWLLSLADGSKLIIKCFPIHGNALLLKEGEVLSVFRRSRQKDFSFDLTKIDKESPSQSRCLEMIQFPSAFSKSLPQWPTHFWEAWLHHRSFYWDTSLKTVVPSEKPKFQAPLSIAKEAFKSILPAFVLKQKKESAIRQLEMQEKQLLGKLQAAQDALLSLLDAVDYQTQGQLLLANLHALGGGLKEVQLERWDAPGEKVRIKLDPSLSLVENANRLFQKAKNQHIAFEKQEEYQVHLQNQLAQLKLKKESLSQLERLRDFKKARLDVAPSQKMAAPWRVFRLQGFEIWIGKSAAGNDELLRRAHKDDYWLHARDVSGSHVLVRNAGKKVPQPVLEMAASWAAFYSKGKKEQFCPVSYTPRKYVRKPKGAAPGSVLIDRENVLIVPPLSPSASE